MTERMVVVGGGVAAIRTIESARAAGFTGHITLVSDEGHPPYERPPLSKQVLTGNYDERILFPRSTAELEQLDVTYRLNTRAESLDRGRMAVRLHDGSDVYYDYLAIATGARARTLPFDHPPGVYTIRTIEDSLEISAELAYRPRVAVVGAGFIGLEVASTARALGCDVTLIESGRVPLVRALGQTMGVHCAALHESRGVNVLTRGRVVGFTSSDRVTGVVLDDGILPVDLVVVGIGAIPNVEWLYGSGLTIANGVLCDAGGRADESGRVFALGDVAAWWDPRTGRHVRHEHWTSAGDQANHIGKLIAGAEPPELVSPPYFWSDQHGVKIQMAGTASDTDDLTVLHGSLPEGRFLAAYSQDDVLTAILGFDAPRLVAQFRALLAHGGTLDDARQLAVKLAPAPPSGRSEQHHQVQTPTSLTEALK
ncbi:FAD/NAD(P)-binding oxidoreductase [Okibacterium endophyticum]